MAKKMKSISTLFITIGTVGFFIGLGYPIFIKISDVNRKREDFSQIHDLKLKVKILKSNIEIINGEIVDLETEFSKNKKKEDFISNEFNKTQDDLSLLKNEIEIAKSKISTRNKEIAALSAFYNNYVMAAQGDANALFILGTGYKDGIEGQQNLTKAIQYLSDAVQKGHRNAAFHLANIYAMDLITSENMKKALEIYKQEAEKGNHESQFEYGRCLLIGIGGKQDADQGLQWIHKAAFHGYTEAQEFLAFCYYYGFGVKQNISEAVKYDLQIESQQRKQLLGIYYSHFLSDKNIDKNILDRIFAEIQANAEKGNIQAIFEMGQYYQGEHNDQEAMKYLQKAAEAGVAGAYCSIASCYENARGVEKNLSKAFYFFSEAAKRGDRYAATAIATNLIQGQGVKQDIAKGIKQYLTIPIDESTEYLGLGFLLSVFFQNNKNDFHTAITTLQNLALQGNSNAQMEIALCYMDGIGVEKNLSKAFQSFEQSAMQGNSCAQLMLGLCYDQGKGTTQNQTKAVQWYRKAALKNNLKAQYNLGLCYLRGTGAKKNVNEAFRWLFLAAIKGHIKSQAILGECLSNGVMSSTNPQWGIFWYTLAAVRGSAEAQINLATCYMKGKNIDRNPQLAALWFRKAAEQGNPLGQGYLGICYEKGDGVPQSTQEAIKWYQLAAKNSPEQTIQECRWLTLAAELGNADSQFALGIYYAKSNNWPMTKEYLGRAASQGHHGAKVLLESMIKFIKANQELLERENGYQ